MALISKRFWKSWVIRSNGQRPSCALWSKNSWAMTRWAYRVGSLSLSWLSLPLDTYLTLLSFSVKTCQVRSWRRFSQSQRVCRTVSSSALKPGRSWMTQRLWRTSPSGWRRHNWRPCCRGWVRREEIEDKLYRIRTVTLMSTVFGKNWENERLIEKSKETNWAILFQIKSNLHYLWYHLLYIHCKDHFRKNEMFLYSCIRIWIPQSWWRSCPALYFTVFL